MNPADEPDTPAARREVQQLPPDPFPLPQQNSSHKWQTCQFGLGTTGYRVTRQRFTGSPLQSRFCCSPRGGLRMIAEREFPSLNACLQHIKSNFGPSQTIALQAKQIGTGKRIGVRNAPAFLYRGESHCFPTTKSSMQRMKSQSGLPRNVKFIIARVAKHVDAGLREFMGYLSLHDHKLTLDDPMLSAGFCQHYGLPTKLIDATSRLDVMAYFASGGTVGEQGALCVFPVDVISKNSVAIALTRHPYGIRPHKQSAFAIFNKNYIDFKSIPCIGQL